MQTEPEKQYSYFLQLESMVKVALGIYGAILVTCIMEIALGIDYTIDEVSHGNYRLLVLTLFGIGGIFLGTHSLVGRVRWVSKFNVWLDRTFFGVLERSNRILLEAIFESDGFQHGPTWTFADDFKKQSFAQDMFRRMANDDRLFQYLLESNIFRLWIWYWILLYGSFAFTILTVGFFASIAFTMGVSTRVVFASLWIPALLHIILGLLLGKYLLRVTRLTATTIVSSYRAEIALMLEESKHDVHRSTSATMSSK